jgi:hypothetical protein
MCALLLAVLMTIADCGLGISDWGVCNRQSAIQNPQSP